MSSARTHPWLGLYILTFAVFGGITTEVVPIGLLPQIQTAFDVDEAAAGSLVWVYALLVAVTAVPLARLTARFPRKPLLLTALGVFIAANVLSALAPSFAVLVIARAIAGVAHAVFFATAIGFSARIAPRGQTARGIALVSSGIAAGLIVGVPAGTAVGDVLGWQLTFGLLAAIMLVSGVAAIFLLPSPEHDAEASRKLIPGGARMLVAAGFSGLAFFGYYMLYSYVSPMLLASGLPTGWLGAVLAGLGVMGLIGIRIAAPSLDRHHYRWMLSVPLTIALLQILLGLVFPGLVLVLIVTALWTMSWGPINSIYQTAVVRAAGDGPDMAGAWINVISNIGIGAGAWVGGLLVVGPGYPTAAFVGSAVLLVSFAITVLTRAWYDAKYAANRV